MDTAAAPVRVPQAILERLMVLSAAAAPLEACGLLLGRGDDVIRAMPARNADASPTRYTIAPEDHFAALRAARADGLAVIGAYHSHPAGGPEPSATDRAEASPDFLYVIVGLRPPAVRAWRLRSGNFVPVSLVRT